MQSEVAIRNFRVQAGALCSMARLAGSLTGITCGIGIAKLVHVPTRVFKRELEHLPHRWIHLVLFSDPLEQHHRGHHSPRSNLAAIVE